MGRQIGPLDRWILTPHPRLESIVILLPTSFLFYLMSSPAGAFGEIPFLIFLLFLVVAHRIIWTLLQLTIAFYFKQPKGPVLRWALIFSLIYFPAALAIAFFQVPMQLRFYASKSAMNAFMADLVNNPGKPRPAVQRVGLYMMRTTWRRRQDGVLQFYVADKYDENGFGYSPIPIQYAGTNPGDGGHLQGAWYWFSDD